MSSIVLQPGVKDMLLADCKDFLQSEEWSVVVVYAFTRNDMYDLGTPSVVSHSAAATFCMVFPDPARLRSSIRSPVNWALTSTLCL